MTINDPRSGYSSPGGSGGGGGSGVSSWNTRTGAVTLAAADVEGLFTATGQVFVGTGVGTGVLSTISSGGPLFNNLGVGIAPGNAGQGFIWMALAGGLAWGNGSINIQLSGTILMQSSGTFQAPILNASQGIGTPGTISTPTLGAAAQLNTSYNVMCYIAVGTTGQLTIAVGNTVSVTTTIINAAVATAGSLYTIWLPKGFYIAVTTSSTATWTTTAIV